MKAIVFFLSMFILTVSCKKQEAAAPEKPFTLAVVQVKPIAVITDSSATIEVTIIDSGGAAINSKGIVWDTKPDPTISLLTKSDAGPGAGTFTTTITGLLPTTTYYVRAYATNIRGTAYSAATKINTEETIYLPDVVTLPSGTSMGASIYLYGDISGDGGSPIIEKGFVYGLDTNLSVVHSSKEIVASCETCGLFAEVDSLTLYSTYYFKAFATNAAGTGYGNLDSFVTINPYWQTLDLYHDQNTHKILDTVNLGGSYYDKRTGSVRNQLILPEGAGLYVLFLSADTSTRYTIGGISYVPKGNDTIYIPKDSLFRAERGVYIDVYGLLHYGSCSFSTHIFGKAKTTESTYYCKYLKQYNGTNTTVDWDYQTDTSVLCNYEH